jgi:hypothetical protein
MVAFESGASRPPGAMSRPPRRLRRSCTHDGADLLRDALGQFICDICGQPGPGRAARAAPSSARTASSA